MIPLTIDPRIAVALPDFAVGVIEVDRVQVTEHDAGLWSEIDARLAEITSILQVEAVAEIPQVAALRRAYRTLGKDPTRYRGSQEALLRRVLKGKGLYHINTVVDINNLISLESFHSIGTFDVSRIEPPVVLRAGLPGETYYGIGRDLLNVEGLPLLTDRQGPFGSPTSDSERSKVTIATAATLTTILSFTGTAKLADQCQRMARLLGQYAAARETDIHTSILTRDGRDPL
jgi:DNA/RNA-binding domain of Phe-tRNA-synthetase-like protein